MRVIMSEIGSVIFCSLSTSNSRLPTPNSGRGVWGLGVFLYQELFVTPVTSPSSASLRKHRRHMANLRMYARGRPHRRHRLRWRILNFSVLASLAIFAVVAIHPSSLGPRPQGSGFRVVRAAGPRPLRPEAWALRPS